MASINLHNKKMNWAAGLLILVQVIKIHTKRLLKFAKEPRLYLLRRVSKTMLFNKIEIIFNQ